MLAVPCEQRISAVRHNSESPADFAAKLTIVAECGMLLRGSRLERHVQS